MWLTSYLRPAIVALLSLAVVLLFTASGSHAAWASTPASGLIDFETPNLGEDTGQVIDPYVDPVTQVTFSTEPGFAVVIVKNRPDGTSACVEPPSDNQKLGTVHELGRAGEPVRATFSSPLVSPVTVTTEFQVEAGATIRLNLFDASDAEVGSITESASPPSGTCGLPGRQRARTTVSVTSAQPVAYAIMDTTEGAFVFVIDNFGFDADSDSKDRDSGDSDSGPSALTYVAVAGGVGVALAAGGWYARRRWLR